MICAATAVVTFLSLCAALVLFFVLYALRLPDPPKEE